MLHLYKLTVFKTYYVWENVKTGDYLVRTTSYSLPLNLHDHVDLIQPTTMFSTWKGMGSTAFLDQVVNPETVTGQYHNPDNGVVVDKSCNVTITVDCLKQLYNVPLDYKLQAPEKNSIAITSYLEEYANIADLQLFYADQVPQAVNTSFKLISINGKLFYVHRRALIILLQEGKTFRMALSLV